MFCDLLHIYHANQQKWSSPVPFLLSYWLEKEAHWPLFCTKPMLFLVGPFKASPIYIFILYKEVLPHM